MPCAITYIGGKPVSVRGAPHPPGVRHVPRSVLAETAISMIDPLAPGLARFNALPADAAERLLHDCCSSARFAAAVSSQRPFDSYAGLVASADRALAGLSETDLDQALAGHPRIGEHARSAASRREQAGAITAGAEVITALAAGNTAYEQRFGHVYLVCADGRTGPELLATLNQRMGNDAATERAVTRRELMKINAIRLDRLLRALGEDQ